MSWGIALPSILCKKCTRVTAVDMSKLCSTAGADQQQTGGTTVAGQGHLSSVPQGSV